MKPTRTALDIAEIERHFAEYEQLASEPKTDVRLIRFYKAMSVILEQEHRQRRERFEAVENYNAAVRGLSRSQRQRIKPPKLEP